MKAFEFDRYLIDNYSKFSRSFTKIRATDLKKEVDEQYDSGRFWPESLLSINPRYLSERTIDDLVVSGDLDEDTGKIFKINGKTLKLHRHQAQAIAKAKDKQSFVVTTGKHSANRISVGKDVNLADYFAYLPPDNIVRVSHYDVALSAGQGVTPDEREQIKGCLSFDRQWIDKRGLDPGNLSLVDVKGVSMEPTLHDGDVALIDSKQQDISPGLWAFEQENKLYIKRIKKGKVGICFSSDNQAVVKDKPEWTDIPFRSDQRIIGRTVWSGGMIE